MKIVTDIAELIKVLSAIKTRKHWRVQPRAEGLLCDATVNTSTITLFDTSFSLKELPEQWPSDIKSWKGELILVPDIDNPVNEMDGSIPMYSRCIQAFLLDPVSFLSTVQPFSWSHENGSFMRVPQSVSTHTLYDALATLSTIDREMMVYGWPMEGISIMNGDNDILFIRPPREALTRLNHIKFGITRVGLLTALASFEPVAFNGLMVSQTPIHDYKSLIFDKGIRSGDLIKVSVRNTGQHVSNVIEVSFPSNGSLITLPDNCPSCNAVLIYDDVIKCSNYYCEGVLYRKLLHFCSPDNMGIKGVGKRLADILISNKLVTTVDDLYALTADSLNGIIYAPGISVPKVLKNIHDSRTCKLSQVIRSLSIPGIGIHNAAIVAWLCGDLFNLVSLYNKDESKLLIDLLNASARSHLQNYLSEVSNQRIILALSQELVTEITCITNSKHKFVGKNIAVRDSGFKHLSCTDVANYITKAGGIATTDTDQADYIIIPQDTKTKNGKSTKTVTLTKFLITVLA